MSKKPKVRPAVQPRTHGECCECAVCARRQRPSPGGARTPTLSNDQRDLPRLSADPRARFTRLVDTALEHDGKRGYVTLREDFAVHLDGAHDLARRLWCALGDQERHAFMLCAVLGRSQRQAAQEMSCSAATVNRRLRAAQNALQACR